MNKKLDTLYELCDFVYHDLETANEKAKASGKLSPGDIEYVQVLSSCMKNIKMCIGMIEAEMDGYSGTYWDGKHYSRGTMSMSESGMRGDSYRNRSSYRSRYSGDNARDEFIGELEELMNKAPDEVTRKKFERMIREMN